MVCEPVQQRPEPNTSAGSIGGRWHSARPRCANASGTERFFRLRGPKPGDRGEMGFAGAAILRRFVFTTLWPCRPESYVPDQSMRDLRELAGTAFSRRKVGRRAMMGQEVGWTFHLGARRISPLLSNQCDRWPAASSASDMAGSIVEGEALDVNARRRRTPAATASRPRPQAARKPIAHSCFTRPRGRRRRSVSAPATAWGLEAEDFEWSCSPMFRSVAHVAQRFSVL